MNTITFHNKEICVVSKMNIEQIDDKVFRIPEDPTCAPDPRGLGVLFMERMQKYENNIAQIDAETGATLTHGEILTRSIRVAQNLQARQISTDDIIVLCSYNTMDCNLPLFAGLFLGVRVAPMDPTLSFNDINYLLNIVKPRFIFTGPETEETFEKIVKEQNLKVEIVVYGDTKKHTPFTEFLKSTGKEDDFKAKPVKDVFDTAIIFFSSGTTGYPKGICANHYAIQYHQEELLKIIDPSVIVYFSTLYWISAIMLLTANVLAGSSRVVIKIFDENKVIDIFAKYKVSFTFMATIFTYKLTNKFKPSDISLPHLRYVMIGGAKLSNDQMLTFKKLLPNTVVTSAYGMTEVQGCLTYFCPYRDKHLFNKNHNSSGRPVSGLTYKFVDVETNTIVGKNTPGELRVKGKPLMRGYYNNPDNPFDEDGFLRTGDIAYYDDDYCFYIVDRIKDLIKYKGWHIIPIELEDILLSHPAIKDATIIGLPDDVVGENLTACICLKPGVNITKDEIMEYYNEKTARNDRRKLRGGIYFVDNILRTPSAKPQRRKMRDLIIAGHIK